MENTALNGTTNATKYHEDWKKKKGYRPILVAVSLALLLSLYAGGYLGSGTHLRHGEMGTTNAAASSSSTALVGSGTAASDLKTLTIELDDNELIDGLLSGWLSKGGGNADDLVPIGEECHENDECAIPPGLDHGVCLWVHDGHEGFCQDGKSGSQCDDTSDCVVPKGLDHPVCRHYQCESGQAGATCGQTSDCLPIAGLSQPHAVCRGPDTRGKRCQQGVKGDYCGQDNDCLSNDCRGLGDTAKCHK